MRLLVRLLGGISLAVVVVTAGFSYLDATAQHRIFGEFWTVRTLLVPRDRVPPLQRQEIYQLKSSTTPEGH